MMSLILGTALSFVTAELRMEMKQTKRAFHANVSSPYQLIKWMKSHKAASQTMCLEGITTPSV